jgi:hypothetical protein
VKLVIYVKNFICKTVSVAMAEQQALISTEGVVWALPALVAMFRVIKMHQTGIGLC